MNVTIIRTSGATEQHNVCAAEAIDEIQKLIGADCLDTVNLRDGRVMLVDDNGYECKAESRDYGVELVPVKACKPINPNATELYHSICHPGTTHQIVGDVAIVRDEDFA